jgi:hypothetical protein
MNDEWSISDDAGIPLFSRKTTQPHAKIDSGSRAILSHLWPSEYETPSSAPQCAQTQSTPKNEIYFKCSLQVCVGAVPFNLNDSSRTPDDPEACEKSEQVSEDTVVYHVGIDGLHRANGTCTHHSICSTGACHERSASSHHHHTVTMHLTLCFGTT